MQKMMIREVKQNNRKEFMENLGATALVILTYAVAGFMAGIGAGISIAIILM